MAVAHGPSALWYATRGAGAMALVLLTASIVLGIGEVQLWRPAGVPRFAIAALHRTVSLLAVAFVVIHVLTTLLDPFPRIGLPNTAVPFVTNYRPLWMGLGTLASDLLVALALTSIVRGRLGYRAWRGLHWLAYLCWPVALVHGLGTGSDTTATWMLVLTLACVGTVVLALAGRLRAASTPRLARDAGVAVITGCAIALALWLAAGPLAPGWARRAGTPTSVLTAFSPRSAARPNQRRAIDPLARSFLAAASGRIRNGTSATGTAIVNMTLLLDVGRRLVLRIELAGDALPDGGLHMDRSAVSVGPPDDPRRYVGRVEVLRNTRVRALVGSRAGRALRLTVDLSLAGRRVSGQVRSTPVRGTGT
jgi:DMSO/TMAO reductase YedYZ heme-binding membrane subunit